MSQEVAVSEIASGTWSARARRCLRGRVRRYSERGVSGADHRPATPARDGFNRFVDGEEIGRVPCLAICQDKDSRLFTLYYYDRDWNLLGVATDYQSVHAAKHRAERIYPGSSERWIETRSSVR